MKRIILFVFMSVPLFSMTLDGLIDQAMKHSSVIKQSQAQMALMKQKKAQAQADRFGSIDLVGSFTHYNLPRTLAPLTPAVMATDPEGVATTKDLYSTGVVYSVPLFTGFAQTREVEMSALSESVAQSKLMLTKEQLAYNVASLYLSILALEEMKQAQAKHVEALKRLRSVVATAVDLGKKAQIDLLKAEKDLYANISYYEVIKSNIEMTKASLASLVGIDDVGRLQRVKVTLKRPRYTISTLMARASELNRMKIAQYNVKRADKGVEKSRASLYPQVVLNSYYGYNYGENDPTNPKSGEWDSEKNWQVGVNAQWKVFDFGKRSAAIEQAKIAKMQAQTDKEQTLRELKKLLIEAREKMVQAYANYRGDTKQLQLAQKSEKIERVRYKNGVSTINDLLYAVAQTQLARAKKIESKYNYQKAKFYMDYLLEQGISSHHAE